MRLQRAMHGRNTIGISVSVASLAFLCYILFFLSSSHSGWRCPDLFSPFPCLVLSCHGLSCLTGFFLLLAPLWRIFHTIICIILAQAPHPHGRFFVFGHPLFPPPTPLLSLHTCQQPFFPSISFSHSRRDPKYWDGGGFWILDLSLDRISGQPFETRLNKSSGLRVLGYLL